MMTTTQPPRDTIDQDLVAIRALSSITSQQADIIAQVVGASGQAWSFRTFDDYDGYLSIFIESTVRDDEKKVIFIAGTAQNFQLFEGHGDDVVAIAAVNNVEELSARLLDLIGQQ